MIVNDWTILYDSLQLVKRCMINTIHCSLRRTPRERDVMTTSALLVMMLE